MRRYIMSGSTYGKLMMLAGLLTIVPLAILPFYPAESKYIPAFLLPGLISLVAGFVICVLMPTKEERDTEWQSPLQKGSLPVVFAWCFGCFLGALPFVIGGQGGFIRALFESVSGWTTTGLSVFDVTALPYIFLFHRSFMQYCGGMGFIIIIVMLVKSKQAMNLYSAEGHPDRIMPNLKETARTIFWLDGGFLVIGTLLYRIFGMGLFDAVCHTMSALSTAGFTTRAGSIGEYNSLPIELITVVLMLIGASNFAVLWMLSKRQLRQIIKVTEIRFMLGLLLVFVPFSAFSLIAGMEMGLGESFRQALFGVVTVFSTTGYSTMNYSLWPPFALGLVMLLMIIGGSTGSTAGGIKLLRTSFILRITRENIRRRFSPARQVVKPTYNAVRGEQLIDDSLVADTFGFVACYIGVFCLGSLLITLTAGGSLFDAMFEFASALGTVGISNGMTNANTDAGTLIIEMVGMLLGRLEIFIVFVGIYSAGHTCRQWVEKTLTSLRRKGGGKKLS